MMASVGWHPSSLRGISWAVIQKYIRIVFILTPPTAGVPLPLDALLYHSYFEHEPSLT
jgi:hypothetical protein